MTTAPRAQDHGAFPALDGLRALAVTGVVVTHAAYWTGHYEQGVGVDVLSRLDIGVAIFFVLSGFLLARPWLIAAATAGPSPSVPVYAWRRVLRILPAYYLTVVLAFALVQKHAPVRAADWWRHAALLQIYHLGWERQGLTQTWSLCTEAAFYVVLPLLGWAALAATRRWGWSPRLLLGGCAVLMAIPVGWYAYIHATGQSAFSSAGLWLPGYLGWFAAGIALAVVRVHLDHHPPSSASRWWYIEEIGRHPGVSWTMAGAVFLMALTPLAGPRAIGLPTAGQLVMKSVIYLAATVFLVLPAVFGRAPITAAVFANRPMRFYGRVSYSVFLLHLVVLIGVAKVLGNGPFAGSTFQVAILTLAATIPLSALCYRWIERPFMSSRYPPGHRRSAPTPRAREPIEVSATS